MLHGRCRLRMLIPWRGCTTSRGVRSRYARVRTYGTEADPLLEKYDHPGQRQSSASSHLCEDHQRVPSHLHTPLAYVFLWPPCRWCSRSAGMTSAGVWWPLWRRSSAAWYVTPIHPPLIYAPLFLFLLASCSCSGMYRDFQVLEAVFPSPASSLSLPDPARTQALPLACYRCRRWG
jgi:hypothetical protein